ncbi:MAG: DUF3857 and transglutaminase domain-containing protein [bacterium]|nr:DUF3857 and transglutaminase domain-containing protein [bacterium]
MYFRFLLITLLLVLGYVPGRAQPRSGSSPYSEQIENAGLAEDYDGANTVLVFDSTWVDVDSTGLSHKRTHTLTKVLTNAGIAELRAARFNYDPASNKIELLVAKVHRKDGSLESISFDGVKDLPQPTHLIYWGARMKVLPIPPLEVGDAVELEYSQMGFQIAYLASDGAEERYIPPMRGTYYDVVMFGSNVLEEATPPIKFKSYTITMPEDKPAQFETYNGDIKSAMIFGDKRYVYHFWKEDVPAFTPETRSPGSTDIVPKVVFTNVRSWAEKSRWFYNVNEGAEVFESDDAIRKEVERITKGCTTDTCKFYALLHWVAQEIRYSGISMGEGEGYTLHPGTMTFRDRAGVCKDIAGMLVTMLRSAGFTTYPVMTQAGSRVERIPADQFNHCVVAVKRGDGSFLMLDPTWTPFNMELWSRAESEQHFVVGSPEGEALSQISKFTPEENDFSFKMKTRLNENGDLSGTVILQGKAQADARVRRPFSDTGQDHWDEICRAWFHKADPAAELTKVTYGDLWDFGKPFAVTMEFSIPNYARRLGKRLDYQPFSSKLLWAGGYQMNLLSGLDSEEREQPILTYNPRQVTLQEVLQLPPGMAIRKLPDLLHEGGEAAWTKGGWKKTPNGTELNYVWHVQERWIPVSDYADVKNATDAIKDYDKIALVIEKGGSR